MKPREKVYLNQDSNQPKTPEEYRQKIVKLEKIVKSKEYRITDLKIRVAMQENENQKMEKEICEIKQFLEDYGLHWIGGSSPEPPTYPNGPIDMDLFNSKIKSLNEACESVKKKQGLKAYSEIPHMVIFLEDNGFHIDSKSLRKYSDSTSDLFFMDIYDGFFPSEFKTQYPNGVFLKVSDKRNPHLFSGTAHTIADNNSSKTPDPEEGEGVLRIKCLDGTEFSQITKPNQKIRQIWRLVSAKINQNDFELTIPPSNTVLDDDATLKSLNLFPHGILFVVSTPK